MPYIPGLRAFREGPAIIQAYYDLEHEPDVLIIPGHGIAHQNRCGLATYVGVELQKSTIGVAKSVLPGDIVEDKIIINNEVCGMLLRTKSHANPIVVSPGHLITTEDAINIVQKCIIQPHKLPEPLVAAHKFVKHIMNNPTSEQKEDVEEDIPEEYKINAGSIV